MKIKALFILIAAFALFLVTPVKTQATDIDVVNTGDNFRLTNRVVCTSTVRVINTNRAFVTQRVNVFANTGLNFVNRNIGDIDIDTGEARIRTNLRFTGNTNQTTIDCN